MDGEPSRERSLILTVSYGQGHNAAAAALAEALAVRGQEVLRVDACAAAAPCFFALTQRFYSFCVRRMPCLWAVTYGLTATADWHLLARSRFLAPALRYLESLLTTYRPAYVYCTYPLYAFLLDVLKARGLFSGDYVLVVTDAIEISRPWMSSFAARIVLPDAYSFRLMTERYARYASRMRLCGFPVRSAFVPDVSRPLPSADTLRVLYSAFAPLADVMRDLAAICQGFPRCRIDVLASSRAGKLRRRIAAAVWGGQVRVWDSLPCLASLLSAAHVYVGKGGAATMFEAYACATPVLVNYALPGQEQGNVEMLMADGCGRLVDGPEDLLHSIRSLLANDACLWRQMCGKMRVLCRKNAAELILQEALAFRCSYEDGNLVVD